jgi:ATP-dependent Zn protease
MSNNLSYIEKKNIINCILASLSGTIKSFNITIDNFSIIVIKVMEILKNYPELTPANKYQLSIDILLKIINNLELDEQHQIYLLGTVHSMVFDLADINTRINNKKLSNNRNQNLNDLNINLNSINPVNPININQRKLKQMEIEIENHSSNNMNDLQEIVNKAFENKVLIHFADFNDVNTFFAFVSKIPDFIIPFFIGTFILNVIRNIVISSTRGGGPGMNQFGGGGGGNPFPFNSQFEVQSIKPNVTLDQWAGSPEVKEECQEVINYVYNRTWSNFRKSVHSFR